MKGKIVPKIEKDKSEISWLKNCRYDKHSMEKNLNNLPNQFGFQILRDISLSYLHFFNKSPIENTTLLNRLETLIRVFYDNPENYDKILFYWRDFNKKYQFYNIKENYVDVFVDNFPDIIDKWVDFSHDYKKILLVISKIRNKNNLKRILSRFLQIFLQKEYNSFNSHEIKIINRILTILYENGFKDLIFDFFQKNAFTIKDLTRFELYNRLEFKKKAALQEEKEKETDFKKEIIKNIVKNEISLFEKENSSLSIREKIDYKSNVRDFYIQFNSKEQNIKRLNEFNPTDLEWIGRKTSLNFQEFLHFQNSYALFKYVLENYLENCPDIIPMTEYICRNQNYVDQFIDEKSIEEISSMKYLIKIDKILISKQNFHFKKVTKNLEFQTRSEMPKIENSFHFAKLTGIKWSQLKRILQWPPLCKWTPYKKISIPKRTGGTREIHIPYQYLKTLQSWIKTEILDNIIQHKCAHGFVKDKSIVTNASAHLGSDLVVTIDLKDFFHTIKSYEVEEVFSSIGYNKIISKILTIICTMQRVKEVNVQDKTIQLYLFYGYRFLPQGSPASPSLSNCAVKNLDDEIDNLCCSKNIKYTRYADDMTFSGSKKLIDIQSLLKEIYVITRKHRFWLNTKKTRVLRTNACQRITGVVTNEKLNPSKKYINQIRGILHKIQKTNDQEMIDLLSLKVKGMISFVYQINPIKAEKYYSKLNSLLLNLKAENK